MAQQPNLRYLNEFFALSCSAGLLQTEAFGRSNPAKEITEAFAMFRAIGNVLPEGFKSFGRKDVFLIVAGDGVTPRLGATVALRSNWSVISIDPTMHVKWVGTDGYKIDPNGIKRLTCIKDKAERVHYPFYNNIDVILALPHSHADAGPVLERLKARRVHVVANPCCVPTAIPGRPTPDEEYVDWGIHSEKRSIQIWRDV